MADKRKMSTVLDEKHPTDSDKQFLEKSNVSNILKDVLGKIISNRPEDPMSFLAHYFDSVEDQGGLVSRAHQAITTTHHSRSVFDSNVRIGYSILSKQKVKKNMWGVNGSIYSNLLEMLCQDLPPAVTGRLRKRIDCYDYEAVPYDVFRSGVYTCCVMQDFVKLSESLFVILDVQDQSKADKLLCDTILEQLRISVASSHGDLRRIMESGYNLAPDGLYDALDSAIRRSSGRTHGTMTSEQFVIEASEAFLSKVKRVK